MSPVLKRKAGDQPAADAKKPKQQGTLTSFFAAPKASPNTSSTPGKAAAGGAASFFESTRTKFDKQKWASKLTEEQRHLLQLEIDTMDESWFSVLKDEMLTKEFLELKRFLEREENAGKKIFPPCQDVYSWSRYTPFHTVKVVILGQDPYHNFGQAHGLAFSVQPPTPAPRSLLNMYTALKNDYPSFVPPPRSGGLLTPWAQRGVLMLNTCLTVRVHEANSHSNRGWERFTQKIIDLVAARRARGVVFMAWGTPAGKRVLKVDPAKHLVLKTVHPSPLSAARGFFDCGHFRLANEWLVKRYGPDGDIDWALTPGNTTKVAPPPQAQPKKAAEPAKKAVAAAAGADAAAPKAVEANTVEVTAKVAAVATKEVAAKGEAAVDDEKKENVTPGPEADEDEEEPIPTA